MRKRTLLWSVVCGGFMGVMLWAGPVGAQPFSGDLLACLKTCITNPNSLKSCTASLATCKTDLAACEAEPAVIFPGDGVDGPALSYHDNLDGTVTDNNTPLCGR